MTASPTGTAHSRMPDFVSRLRVPVVAAPMLIGSTPQLVAQVCAAGVIGSFPTVNARTPADLEVWFDQIDQDIERYRRSDVEPAPPAPNLIVSPGNASRDVDLKVILRRRPDLVITSVGSPAAVLPALHDAGIQVWCDVATLHHAERAIEAGVDGLILLTAGAGGHTGALNPFSFAGAVRARFNGVIALAGGLSDGAGLWAARALGCDLGYMGTRFLATRESGVNPKHKDMIIDSNIDDIHLTSKVTGLPTNLLRAALEKHGLDPETFGMDKRGVVSEQLSAVAAPRRWKDLWSAGHSAHGVNELLGAAEVVERLAAEYTAARSSSLALPEGQ